MPWLETFIFIMFNSVYPLLISLLLCACQDSVSQQFTEQSSPSVHQTSLRAPRWLGLADRAAKQYSPTLIRLWRHSPPGSDRVTVLQPYFPVAPHYLPLHTSPPCPPFWHYYCYIVATTGPWQKSKNPVCAKCWGRICSERLQK